MKSQDKSYDVAVGIMDCIRKYDGNKYRIEIGKFHRYLPRRNGFQLQIRMGYFLGTRVAVIYVENLADWMVSKKRPKRKPQIDVVLDKRFMFLKDDLQRIIAEVNRGLVNQKFHLDYAVSF
jgi:hypothetical protein